MLCSEYILLSFSARYLPFQLRPLCEGTMEGLDRHTVRNGSSRYYSVPVARTDQRQLC